MSPPSFLCNLIVPSHFFPPLCPEHILILWCKYKTSFSLASYFFPRSRKVSQDQWPESTNFARKKEKRETYRKRIMREGFPKGPLGAQQTMFWGEQLAGHNKTYFVLHIVKISSLDESSRNPLDYAKHVRQKKESRFDLKTHPPLWLPRDFMHACVN